MTLGSKSLQLEIKLAKTAKMMRVLSFISELLESTLKCNVNGFFIRLDDSFFFQEGEVEVLHVRNKAFKAVDL